MLYHLGQNLKEIKNTSLKYKILFAVPIILQLVGLFGLNSSFSKWFVPLTALNLLMSAVIIFWFHKPKNKIFMVSIAICFIVGMFAEGIGVNTGLLFGNYHYPATLGPQLFGVPIIIGINWAMLVYCIGSLLNHLKVNPLLIAVLGAIGITAMDFLIEPFAVKHNLWVWKNNIIPTKNYLGWFGISFVLFLAQQKLLSQFKNKLATTMAVVFYLFFLVNYILIEA